MKRYIKADSGWLHMHEDDVADLIEEINSLDEWDSDQVDSLIQYAMEADSAFESNWQWAFDCKETVSMLWVIGILMMRIFVMTT